MTLSPAGTPSRCSSRMAIKSSVFGTFALMPSIKPFAANFLDDVGEAILERGEPLAEDERRIPHIVEEAISQHDVEHGIADGHAKRIAAIGRAMRAGLHAVCGLFGGQAGAEREAATDALGHRHDVGRDTRPFMGKQLAGAPDAALDLVEDQQQAMFVAEVTQRTENPRRGSGECRLPPEPARPGLQRLHL